MVPLSLECDNQQLLDIGVYLEYVRQPFVTVSGTQCFAFSPCMLALNVTSPPRGILSGNDLDVQLLNIQFDQAPDSSSPILPTVQVRLFLAEPLSKLCTGLYGFDESSIIIDPVEPQNAVKRIWTSDKQYV